MPKLHTAKAKFKRVSTMSFLLQSNWKGDINTLEPYAISKRRHQGMKKMYQKNYGKAGK